MRWTPGLELMMAIHGWERVYPDGTTARARLAAAVQAVPPEAEAGLLAMAEAARAVLDGTGSATVLAAVATAWRSAQIAADPRPGDRRHASAATSTYAALAAEAMEAGGWWRTGAFDE